MIKVIKIALEHFDGILTPLLETFTELQNSSK
jgi:hypothetical protein